MAELPTIKQISSVKRRRETDRRINQKINEILQSVAFGSRKLNATDIVWLVSRNNTGGVFHGMPYPEESKDWDAKHEAILRIALAQHNVRLPTEFYHFEVFTFSEEQMDMIRLFYQ